MLTSITININREGERYTCDTYFSNPEFTEEDGFSLLQSILEDLVAKNGFVKIKKYDTYNISFTLHYYDDVNNPADFKYISVPKLNEEKLAEYLFTIVAIHDYKTNN